MSGTRCAVRACPFTLRLFTLEWPWYCPAHKQEEREAEHADTIMRRSAALRLLKGEQT